MLMTVLKIAVVVFYLLLMVWAGMKEMKRSKTFNDMFLGGSSVGPIISGFSYGMSYFSAVIFIGFSGMIGWLYGLAGIWLGISNAVLGVLLIWITVGPKAKDASMELGVSTLPEYFKVRYGSSFFQIFCSIITFVFLVPYTASIMIGLGYLFTAVFQIPFVISIIGIAIFVGIYLLLGGYKSMAKIDGVFGMILIIGCVAYVATLLVQGDGWGNMYSRLKAYDPKFVDFWGFGPRPWDVIALCLTTSLPIACMPHMVHKFFAIKDKKSLKSGKWISAFFCLFTGFVAYYVGANARLFVNIKEENGKMLFDAVIPDLMVNIMTGPFSIVLIVMLLLIIAASIAPSAARILNSSATVTQDLYKAYINKNATDKQQTNLMRGCNIIFIIIAILIALSKPSAIVLIFSLSYGAIGGAFIGPWIWGLFWRGTNVYGALAGGLLGFLTDIVLVAGFHVPTYTAAVIAMAVSLVIVPIVSAVSGGSAKNKEMVKIKL